MTYFTDEERRLKVTKARFDAHLATKIAPDWAEAVAIIKRALDDSLGIIYPTSEDMKQRRAIYRFLAFALFYAAGDSAHDNVDELRSLIGIYEMGAPISEEIDDGIIYTYYYIHSLIFRNTELESDERKKYEAALLIYDNCMSRLADPDASEPILLTVATAKAEGIYCRRDIYEAKEIIRKLRATTQYEDVLSVCNSIERFIRGL